MTNQHPITPSPSLKEQWWDAALPNAPMTDPSWSETSIGDRLCDLAARWGADQELEACCDTLQRHAHWDLAVFELMDARRPKPPSLKEQALEALEHILHNSSTELGANTIRRALEQL